MSAPSPSCPDDAAARRLARSMAVVSAFCLTGDTMLYIALPLFWQECGLTALWQVGVLLAVNRLVRLPLNPLVRLLYTRIDQRTGMALAVVLAASTTLLYGVAQSFALWLLLRCLWGLAWTLLRLGSLFALMAASRKDNRGYLMGSYNGLVRLGSLLGMIGGGLLADLLGFSTVALLFGALTLTGLPLALTRIPDMPLVLYCTGDPAWLNAPGLIGMVGSRRPDPYGCQMAAGLGRDLARGGAVIVSGLAEGLDSVCHRAALEGAGPTIGVQGVPIDRTYPASNRWLREEIEASGCVVGEYPPGDNLAGRNGFLQRNRLIAGLARALVVVQARERSGTMSTVAHAERYGRKIFALPGDIGRENAAGTNRLIQSGRARMALSAEEILEELSLRAAPVPDRQEPPLTETQRKVLACAGSEPKSLEELAAACGMQAATLAAVLMGLELAGRIKALPGQRYILL